ncbi:ribonuclease P protein component [Candidatus Saccharibacteria bacterium]|nr:ribonuclease P protein component [Candidatus Saccharibacteria bacterium]
MLNKKYRFHSRGGVKYVYRHGKTIRKPDCSLVFCNNERGRTRVAVVVSKKVEKTAVGRNRLRRRVYEAVRVNFDKLKKPRDYIFVIYSKRLIGIPFEDLEKLLCSLLKESMLQ